MILGIVMASFVLSGCSDNDGVPADEVGVGAMCVANSDCPEVMGQNDDGERIELVCMTQFKGGYCGLMGCTGNVDCPLGSACVAADDGQNYCFRQCVDKSECNINRTVDNESNCVANITFVDAETRGKACVPPTGN